ncbi:MAG: glycoside hydrolase family 9 protein [Clostridium sp.]|nr:glycoside hydrolase family 9 protein [Clostridium sp.]
MRQMGKTGKRKRISAWLLTAVMVLSLVMVPAGTVEAAEGDKITVTGAKDTSKAVHVKVTEEKVITQWDDGTVLSEPLTQYKVEIVNGSSETISDWELTIACSSLSTFNAGWNGASKSGNNIKVGTYKGTGNDGVWTNATIAAGESASGAGFQVAAKELENATYTLIYKKGESSGSVSVDDTATDPAQIGSTSSKVTATITKSNIAGDYHEYYLQVSNGLSGENISDWVVAIPLTGVTGVQNWASEGWAKVQAYYTSDYLYVSPVGDAVISAGTTFGSSTEGAYKFNYKGNNDVDSAKVVVYYKTGSSATGAFDKVIDNANVDSGSGGGGSIGGSGSVQGDTTTNLNLEVEYNFAKLLQYSLYFYDANMCGELEGKCAVDWRKNCHLADKKATYNGKTVDVSGGFHDAGDHDKFGLPQGYTASMLGIGYYEYKDAYTKTGQTSHFKTILDYFCDYFVRCTVLDGSGNAQAFCYQVGDGSSHSYWVSAEKENINRPAYFADSSNPATDQVSEAAAALAIHYLNFGNETYLDYAKKLFAMAKKNKKAAKTTDNGTFYTSSSWADDYCLAAAWLYKATKDSDYLSEYNANKGAIEAGAWPSWDQVGPYALAYGGDDFSPLAANATATINQTTTISNGYAYLCMWGSARYNSNIQLEGLIYDKNTDKDQYTTWANGQMKFLLGNSADKRCYVVGYNENSSKYPHHRSSSGYGGFPDSGYQTAVQAHVLMGALVGGIEGSDGTYHDSSADYYCNEVAIDYNAAFTGAVAALYLLNEEDEDQMLDSNYAIDSSATCPANEGGIAANGSEEIVKTELKDTDIEFPTAKGITYGQTLAAAILSKTSDDYGGYAWKDATIKPTVGTKEYEVEYTPTNAKNYDYSKLTGYDTASKKVIRKVSVTVSPKIITEITFPTVSSTVTAGTKLSGIKLSKTSDDYGTFAWKNPDTVAKGSMTGADVVYTLKDSANVEISAAVAGVNADKSAVTRNVAFTVTKKKLTITGPSSITVNAGTKLTEVDIPLTGTNAFSVGDVEGTFSWEEADKTLTSKDKSFTLVFTPDDTDSYDSAKKTVTFNVQKIANPKTPEKPVLTSKTAESVTLTVYAGAGKVEYGCKSGSGNYKWQASNEFINLSPYTTYTFAERFVADDIYNAGSASEALEVTTYLSEQDCYKIDLSKISDKYVDAHNGTISYDSKTKTVTLLENEAYTITGKGNDITISCESANTVTLDNAEFKRLEADSDVVIKLIGKNVVTEGISGNDITIQNGSQTATAGALTVSGNSDGAIYAESITLESGQVTATGSGTAAALKASDTIELFGGSLTANADAGVIPIQATTIKLDGCQVQSKADPIYSPKPVDKNGNEVSTCTVTYKEGDTESEPYSVNVGGEITLKSLTRKKGFKAQGWTVEGSDEMLLPGSKVTVSADIVYIAKYEEITDSITVEVKEEVTPLTVGYASDEGILVTITNRTNVTLDEIKLDLASDDDFTIDVDRLQNVAAGDSENIYVKLKKGKGVSTDGYKVKLTVSCDELQESKDIIETEITRTVKKAQAAKPNDKPVIVDRTSDAITLDLVDGVQYGIKKGGEFDWQDSRVFVDLESNTTYTFAIRYKATDDEEASEPSDTVEATTLMSQKDSYVVDVTKLEDADYVGNHGDTISVDNNTLTLEKEGTYTITGENPNVTIVAKENVTIILDNAEVAAIKGDKNITIQLVGSSKIGSDTENASAIEGGTVTISKGETETGTVTIQGGTGAAGIKAGEVTITDGTVTVTGGTGAAGIEADEVTITGGTVTVTGGAGDTAAIDADKVTITGGTVSVTGQGNKPAIDAADKKITIEIKKTDGEDYKDPEGSEDPDKKDEKKPVESIKVTLSAASITKGQTATASVEVLPADATDKTVTWSSSKSSVATVSPSGVVTAVAAGNAKIIATANDGSGISGEAEITVKDDSQTGGQDNGQADDEAIKATGMTITADVKGASDVPVKSTFKLAPKKKMALNITFAPEDAAEEDLTFTSSNSSIATVDEDGQITAGKKAGTTVITVTAEGGLKKTFKVQVMKKPVKKVKIKASKKVVKVKKKLKLKTALTPNKKQASDSVYWKSSNTKVAVVSASGVVQGVKKGKAKITAVATDGSGKKATITIQVK